MNYPVFFDSKNSVHLYGLKKKFDFLSNLYYEKNLPNVFIFSGNKGSGKSTLINHFLYSVFDCDNYDKDNYTFNDKSTFFKQFKNDIFSNIIYIKGSDYKSVKVDDIRKLKTKIFQSTILSKERFIVFDDIELFNQNSLNALLKIIEEPSKNTHFFLINNKAKPLLDTIKSRALEIKIFLNEDVRLEIINKLVNSFKIDLILDPKSSLLTPGNFIKLNYICKEHNISPSKDLFENISFLLGLYKKNKDIIFINLIFFIIDHHFTNLSKKNILDNGRIYEIKNYIFDNLNKFMLYNINQNTLLNAIQTKLRYE